MGLESATYVGELNALNPDGANDPKSQGDNHIKMIKAALQATFPGMVGRAWRTQTKSGNYTVLSTDNMSLLNCTTALTLSLTAAITLGNGHLFLVSANGGDVTIDPNGSEQIEGGDTIVVPDGYMALVLCSGLEFTAFYLPRTQQAWYTGDAKVSYRTTADPGWVLANDGSIGNSVSAATARANDDTEALFTHFWDTIPDSICPVSGGRGANAAEDFAAGKKLTIPKALGRALVVAGTGAGLTERLLGDSDGAETHTLTQAETPLKQHTHTVSDPTHAHGVNDGTHAHNYYDVRSGGGTGFGGISSGPGTTSGVTSSNGSNISIQAAATGISLQNASSDSADPHNIMQPSSYMNFMIKL